jgi:hypothetical protein
MDKSKGCAAALLAALWLGVMLPASAALVISEVMYDAGGSDAGNVFVELYGSPGESLDGLVLEGVNGSNGSTYLSITLAGVIPADGVFVIGDDSGGVTFVDNADFIADVDFQNGPDSVVLRNDSIILDAVGYGIFSGSDIFAGEGSSAPDPVAGSSIARIDPTLDSNDNSVDFFVLEMPTPGVVATVAAVPVPPALLLFSSGLVWLIRTARGGHKSG